MEILEWFENFSQDRRDALTKFHEQHVTLFESAWGSKNNHQAWDGGYSDHIQQCFIIGNAIYASLYQREFHFRFSWQSALMVLYFHDIEKLFKYGDLSLPDFDKETFYLKTLPEKWNIKFTDEEMNALKYIHGEGKDYTGNRRVMNELAGFCHAVDTLSARTFHDQVVSHGVPMMKKK